ncbi:MAG: GDP-mannose 4,6-dehydratase [Candidatus Omnitrophica bacterium]|nr:GDP-mannose 4,6-dehydratase [Candidatus Omnitrophota bacterium]
MDFKSENIPHNSTLLVTGGAGFIGSHVCERLLDRGFRVVCLDDLNDYYSPDWKWANLEKSRSCESFQFVRGSLLDLGLLRDLFDREAPSAVLHFAARAGVRPSLRDPKLYEATNGRGTLNILELCREFKMSRLIYTSSSSVYGERFNMPLRETDPIMNPISPYGAAKYASEKMCQVYQSLTGMDLNVIRPFTVYGPRQRPDMAIFKFTRMIDRGLSIPLFGDGSTARDYTFISDFVDGVEKALHFSGGFRIFNLGGSHSTRLIDLVHTISEALDKKPEIEFQPTQPGDVPLTLADISRARDELGYEPKISVPEGIQRFVDWYRSSAQVGRA